MLSTTSIVHKKNQASRVPSSFAFTFLTLAKRIFSLGFNLILYYSFTSGILAKIENKQ
jgi:hypothetical protein